MARKHSHDDAIDLLVLGGGMAGLSAAAKAASDGARVVLAEKGRAIGGSAVYAGYIWTAPTLEVMHEVNPDADPVLAERVVTGYDEGLAWVRSLGVHVAEPVTVLGYGRGCQTDVANYLLALIRDVFEVPYGERCMHEFVASAKTLRREKKISAMDVAKRLLDFGYHAPTVYFPLVVPEAIMIEPTETESQETLEAFARAMRQISGEDAEFLHQAPHTLEISRPDEVLAAKEPILRWIPAK